MGACSESLVCLLTDVYCKLLVITQPLFSSYWPCFWSPIESCLSFIFILLIPLPQLIFYFFQPMWKQWNNSHYIFATSQQPMHFHYPKVNMKGNVKEIICWWAAIFFHITKKTKRAEVEFSVFKHNVKIQLKIRIKVGSCTECT